jgi:hypothetical protein
VDAHEDLGIYPTKLLFSQLQGKQKNIYEYLPNAQQTKYAVIPLHTEDEYNLGVYGLHQQAFLTLTIWLLGGPLKQMEKQFFIS